MFNWLRNLFVKKKKQENKPQKKELYRTRNYIHYNDGSKEPIITGMYHADHDPFIGDGD